MAPDGVMTDMMVFNNQYPGPAIVADWGDTIQITVKNSLANGNGTSVHWHGLRQLNSNQMDGTNGITECPIAPGQSRTYTFKATEYGTSWYHSHYSVQYGDGLVGPIIINGPASSNYDIDLGVLPLTDWFHTPNFEIIASRPPGPPLSQNILVNGTGMYNGTMGKFGSTNLIPGKTHRLRLVNTGINNYIHVSLDNHPFTVITSDFIPIKPYQTTSLTIGVGQRYDVIIKADQAIGNYWFRVATGGGQCDGPNEKMASNNTQGYIFNYDGCNRDSAPTSTSYTLSQGCVEETSIAPIVQFTVPAPPTPPTKLDLVLDTSKGVAWKVNGNAMVIDWKTPTLSYIMNGTYNLPAIDNGLIINQAGWTYWLIQNDTPLPHPIHLHGHDFFVLAAGTGDGATANYTLNNPIRRDTHTADAQGYMVIAFQADNPGAWLMHCHIPFHISGGLGVQFVERPSEVKGLLGDVSVFNQGCASWATFGQTGPLGFTQPDSGL